MMWCDDSENDMESICQGYPSKEELGYYGQIWAPAEDDSAFCYGLCQEDLGYSGP